MYLNFRYDKNQLKDVWMHYVDEHQMNITYLLA